MNKENKRILSIANPTLATEWHPSKNGDLTPHDLTIGSGKKVWWLCSKNPQHVWEAKVLNRGKGNGCPYCNGNKVSQDNCLQTLNPKLAKEWHPSKNSTLTPSEVTTGSSRKVWWLCPKNELHSWQAVISSRHTGGHGCPYCSGKLASEENSLATLNPMLATEWHPSKNGTKMPNDFTVNSGKKVWWQCHINPQHEWQAVIASRNNGHGCPECGREKTEKARNKIIEGKSLGLIRPDLLNEWNYNRNKEISPFSFASKSSKRVWWKCSVNQEHEWKTAISERVNGSKCPYCIGRLSTPVTSLAFVNPLLADEWHPLKNKGLTPDDVMPNSGKKVWWQCPFNPEHIWQATIANRHGRGDRCPNCHSATSFSEQAIFYYLKQSLPHSHQLSLLLFSLNPPGFQSS